jgi:hypothetical protein
MTFIAPMEIKIAKALSYLFHPLFVPFYTILLLLNLESYFLLSIPFNWKLILGGIVFLTTAILPFLTTLFFVKKKVVRSFFMETREERIYPLLNTAIFYYLTYYLLKGAHLSPVFSYFMLGSTLLAICSMMISFFYMISLHMISLGGVLGMFTGICINLALDLVPVILVVILVAGLTGYARLKLNSHKPPEIYYGLILGAGIMFLVFCLV